MAGARKFDAVKPVILVALGLLPWALVAFGAYELSSAVAAFAFYHGYCLLVALTNRRNRWRDKPQSLRIWAGLVISGLLVCAVTYTVLKWMPLPHFLLDPNRVTQSMAALQLSKAPAALTALFVYFAVVNPIAEELFWRGTIFAGLRDAGWKVKRASVVTALLFGSWHWLIVRQFFEPYMALLITLGITMVGYIFAQVYERLKSQPALMLIHGLGADIPILITLWFTMIGRR